MSLELFCLIIFFGGFVGIIWAARRRKPDPLANIEIVENDNIKPGQFGLRYSGRQQGKTFLVYHDSHLAPTTPPPQSNNDFLKDAIVGVAADELVRRFNENKKGSVDILEPEEPKVGWKGSGGEFSGAGASGGWEDDSSSDSVSDDSERVEDDESSGSVGSDGSGTSDDD